MEGRSDSSVDVVLESDTSTHPLCPHGPTLLFEKYSFKSQKNKRRFYACAASRDQNHCGFFLWADQHIKRKSAAQFSKEFQPRFNRQGFRKRFSQIEESKDIKFCRSCSLLLLPTEWKKHTKHGYLESVKRDTLKKPSHLIQPKENNKSNAQYFFSDRTTSFIVKSLDKFHIKKVLSVCAPRIHEHILHCDSGMKSFLLDIDDRFAQFYGTGDFCQYNLFNNFFFEENEAQSCLTEFLSGEDKLAIVLDPPFGGRVDIIAHSLKKLLSMCPDRTDDPAILFVFPYFNESRIIESIPSLYMLDYKVDYQNHGSFHSNGRKQGSPVRIFTNLNAAKFILPKEENYRFCDICQRYVAEENKHCDICKSCTSKDGRPYRHCSRCNTCVKSSRVHCKKCKHCVLPDHICGEVKLLGACHQCGKQGHKKRECPSKQDEYPPSKRMKT